jgi:thioredoxin 1
MLWAAAIIGIGLGAYVLINRLLLQRSRALVRHLDGFQPGRPGILYFTTPDCAPCKTIQRPALAQVRSQLGEDLQIIEIDATHQPELASEWKVMSVPTTFVIDAHGRPRHVNHGATRAEKLLQQIQEIR